MHPDHEDHETDDEADPLSRLRHALKSPLTTILGRAHLLARSVRRAPSLTDEERARMLDGVAVIEAAVAAMVVIIDDMGPEDPDGGGTTR